MRYQGWAFTMIIAILIGIALIFAGRYPAAFVSMPASLGSDTAVIWARDADRMARSAMTYYAQALGTASSTLVLPEGTEREAFSKSVDALIGNVLVAQAIDTEGFRAETDALLADKMTEYGKQREFSAAIAMLYGLDGDSFMEFVARPETEREIIKAKKGWDDTALAAQIETWKAESSIVRFVK